MLDFIMVDCYRFHNAFTIQKYCSKSTGLIARSDIKKASEDRLLCICIILIQRKKQKKKEIIQKGRAEYLSKKA